jgi:Secretion system C-terminal sorting domain
VPTPGFALNSGKVWRIKARTRAIELVADQFGPGPGMSFDRYGNLYVTNLVTSSLVKKAHAIRHYSGNQRFLSPIEDENTEIAANVRLFPNPASDFLTIEWGNLAKQTPQSVRLIDVTGRVVFEKNGLDGAILPQIDLQNLTSGVYLVQLSTLESVETHKIKVQK